MRLHDGSRALTDLYFPQLALHLEIDEPHHKNRIDPDQLREQDIILATGHRIERMRICDDLGQEKSIELVRAEVDRFVAMVRSAKVSVSEAAGFIRWDWENRYSSSPIIERGYLDVADNVTFRIQIEAMKCFGFTGKGFQRGAWTIPDGTTDQVWFPRLYEHFIWNNELSQDGRHIDERAINDKGRASIAKQFIRSKENPLSKRIVLAKAKDSLGANVLRYVGTFRLNLDASDLDRVQFDLVSSREPVRSAAVKFMV